jgi:putative endonuclease
MPQDYFVYRLASTSRHLYTGVTGNLVKRLYEHRTGITKGYAFEHQASRLVYFEQTPNVRSAIAREKEIKLLKRSRKIDLIEKSNAEWRDLSEDW